MGTSGVQDSFMRRRVGTGDMQGPDGEKKKSSNGVNQIACKNVL